MRKILLAYINIDHVGEIGLRLDKMVVNDPNKTLSEIASDKNEEVRKAFNKSGEGKFCVAEVYEVTDSLEVEWNVQDALDMRQKIRKERMG